MILNCKEVTESISSDHLLKNGWWHQLAVGIHIALCRRCRRYQKQMYEIGSAAREAWSSQPKETRVLVQLEKQILRDVTPTSKSRDGE